MNFADRTVSVSTESFVLPEIITEAINQIGYQGALIQENAQGDEVKNSAEKIYYQSLVHKSMLAIVDASQP